MKTTDLRVSFTQPNPGSLHPKGGNSLLTAQYKAGKTTLGNSLIKSLCDGEAFLGFETRPLSGRVALWNYELEANQEREWLRKLKIEHPERAAIAHLRGYRIPFRSEAARKWAIEWLQRREVEFWILDPAARAATGVDIERNNIDTGEWLELLDEIKRKAGVVDLLLTTHTGRGSSERTAGAHRLDDWPDSLWKLVLENPNDPRSPRWFSAFGRGVDVPDFRLTYDATTGRLDRDFLAGSRAEQRADRKQAADNRRLAAGAQELARIVANEPSIGTTDLKNKWPGNNNDFTVVRAHAMADGLIHAHHQGRARPHYSGQPRAECHPGALVVPDDVGFDG